MRYEFPKLQGRYRTLLYNREKLEEQIRLTNYGTAHKSKQSNIEFELYSVEGMTTPLLLKEMDAEISELEFIFDHFGELGKRRSWKDWQFLLWAALTVLTVLLVMISLWRG